MKKYVDVIVPVPVVGTYTYSLPDELADRVAEGYRVVVPFGRKKFYTGIVTKVHYVAPQAYETKEVTEVLDSSPVLLSRQLALWEWIADYYLCTLGDVYKAALPSGLKLESETVVVLNPLFEAVSSLTEREQRIWALLTDEAEQCVTQLEKETGYKNILSLVKSLLDKGAVQVKEELKQSYKPRTELRVKLGEDYSSESQLHRLFDELGKAPKQLSLLMKYVELSGFLQQGVFLKEVSKKTLLEQSGC